MDDREHLRPSAVPWPPLLFAVALIIGAVLGRVYPLPWPGLDDLPARIFGYGFGLAGVVLVGWGTFTMWRAGTNIMPHKSAGTLVTEGPFRIWRNPLYMGETLVFLGLAQASGNVWMAIVAAGFALGVLKLAILPEERHLEARFGTAYLDYVSRTRRWF